MSENNENETSSKPQTKLTNNTKSSIRKRVWEELKHKNQSMFPPPFGRIPNFKGAKEAANKLLEIQEFTSALHVEVNPDKPLEPCRKLVLEQGKHLYVPTPQLCGSLLKKLDPSKEHDIQKTVSRWGITKLGNEINLEDQIKIDLLIVGSVAVSKDGQRIGKGHGYADLEFALLKEMKAVDDNTVIITVVHDIQVFDELPSELFEIYDVPVDIIVTPTQVVRTGQQLPKPEGIYWNKLSPKTVESIEILTKLKEKHASEGKDVTLSTSQLSEVKQPFFRRRYFKKPNHSKRTSQAKSNTNPEENEKTNNGVEENTKENKEKPLKNKKTDNKNGWRTPRNRKSENLRHVEENQQQKENNIKTVPPKIKKSKKFNKGYSLRVSNIEKSVRVRDLKNALTEKGIRPNFIVWRGFRGFCYLYYAKKKSLVENSESLAIDNIIDKIQMMHINPTQERTLNVNVMDPITRIETVNVTSV